jgi:serine/threonine protein kinase/Tol biopolymer transport system component
MALDIGSILNQRYQIETVIAHGGMGAIYRATDLSLGVQVAVKENLFSTEESSRQFRREATILASLRHPNLPRVTDHFVIPNQGQYLVMDYIEGNDLRNRMEQRDLSEEQVVSIGISICDALTYLHTRPAVILHRDIKPGNIKITPGGQVYLVDFGLAKMAQPGQATTIGAQALTPGYAPPEQYGAGTDARSDIYALGATLYAALTGEIPEDGLARAMGSAELTPIRRRNTNISPQVAMVIEKAMAPIMGDRYQTAEAFKTALLNSNTAARRKLQDQGTAQANTARVNPAETGTQESRDAELEVHHLPVEAAHTPVYTPPPSPAGSSASPLKKRRFPVWIGIAGGLIAVILCITVVGLIFWKTNPWQVDRTATVPAGQSMAQVDATLTMTAEQKNISEKPTQTLASAVIPAEEPTETPTPSQEPTHETSATPAATPVGGGSGQFAFVSDRTGLPQVWIQNMDGTGLTQITNFTDGACQPDWAPDGKRLVVTSPCRTRQDMYKGASLFLLNVDGSGFTPLVSVPGGDFEPAWSPDGKTIAFTSLRNHSFPHIYLYDLATNNVTRLAESSSSDRRPAWSPDGKKIAFETSRGGQGGTAIYIMDSDGSNIQAFSNASAGYAYMPSWAPNGSIITFSRGSNYLAAEKQTSARAIDDDFIISETIQNVTTPRVSADGFWLIYGGQENGKADIYLMTLNGGSLTKLTGKSEEEKGNNFSPVWRPANS